MPVACRIAFYSHDTMGLGHVRRNLLLAQTLQASALSPVTLLVAGSREAGTFAIPHGVDCLTLPAYAKNLDGEYGARHLEISVQELVRLRARTIRAALQDFAPDLLIVDNVPRGALGELDETLDALHAAGTRIVLGIRDILDSGEAVRRQWTKEGNEAVLFKYFDGVWVYGDRRVCDPPTEYGWSASIAAKVTFTGYLDQRRRLTSLPDAAALRRQLGIPDGVLVLGMVGGGQDGADLAEAFVRTPVPDGTVAVLVTGPFMPPEARERLRVLSRHRRDLCVLDFVAEPTMLLACADRVVSMAGYGTVSEILSFGKPALLVPRDTPRQEQLIRAERLAALGLVDCLRQSELSPGAIQRWLLAPKRGFEREVLDINGLQRIPRLVAELFNRGPDSPAVSHARRAVPNA